MIKRILLISLFILNMFIINAEDKLETNNWLSYRFIGEKEWSSNYGYSSYDNPFKLIFNNAPNEVLLKYKDVDFWIGNVWITSLTVTSFSLGWNLVFLFGDQRNLIDWNIIGGMLVVDYIVYEIAKAKLNDTVDSYNKWVEEKNKNLLSMPNVYMSPNKTTLAWNYQF